MDYEAYWKSIDQKYWAWLAGFIDGDGCIGTHRNGTTAAGTQSYKLRLSITQRESEILNEIQATLQVGSVVAYTRKCPESYVHYKLSFGPAITRKLCKYIYPHLRIKQVQAWDAMHHRKPDNGSH